MRRKFMNLQLFADGGEGGSGTQGGNAGTGNGGQTSAGASFSFEQAEEIANARAQRAETSALKSFFQQQGMSEDEVKQALADHKANKEKQKPNVSAIEQERDNALKELETVKNSNTLRDKGIKPEDLDYVLFKVTQKVTDKIDFKKATEDFLKENPRFTCQSYRVTTSTQSGGSGGTENTNDFINNAIRMAARK
ncbi:MAG: hypothetical protein RR875_09465 [Clostridium sp.]